jgi:type IV secretory pathway VirB6-like protein
MIVISAELRQSIVFSQRSSLYHPFGDLMKKSATLITTALLTFGFAAASMAADAPKSGATADSATSAPAAKTKAKKHTAAKKQKKATTAPATTK